MRVYLTVCCLIAHTVSGQVEYSIPEETERGAPVGNLARDLSLDASRLPARKFRMISGSGKQYFGLNASTGALWVQEPVDREQICALKPTCSLNYELVLENPLELYKMHFKILDVNDHAPTFPLEEYHLSVAEFLAPGARFTLPNAQDPDEGINSVQSYVLSPEEHFRLAMQTRGDGSRYPELVLERPLDREQKAMHRLALTAKDGGSPQRSGEARVVVTVLDTNDNAPVFEHSVYRASVSENSPDGTLVTRVRATDLDEGQNGEVRYAFSNSTPAELRKMFRIDPQTGEVKVNGALGVQKPLLEMFVEAKDKGVFGMSSVAKLLVEVTDVNNNAPEITVTSLSSPIPEDSSLGTVIALLSITDEDPGDNGKVICQVPTNIPFQVKSSFDNYYSVVTSGLLDRERVDEYNITVTASDLGSPPIATQKTLRVQIADVNDNPPKFLNQMREVSVTENNQPGVSLLQVTATDSDLGENGRVSYLLRDIDIQGSALSSYLGIDASSGVVYAKGSFDFEQLQSFHFQVEAKDNGSPALAAAFIVSISITDQNDNPPIILYPGVKNSSVAVEIVPRLADADYLVTKVVAHDPDSGQNAWLSYHLLQSSDASLFRVSPNVGEVRTSRSMRSSDPIKHKVVVMVKDSGEPPLSSSVTLGILLADSLPQALPDFDDSLEARGQQLSSLNFYLIIGLACLSVVFLGFLIFLLAMRLFQCRTSYSSSCCCCPADDYEKYRYNVRMLPSSHFTPDMVEVAGMGKLTHTYLYRAALGVGPGNNNMMPNGDVGNLGKGAGLLQVPASCIQVQKVKSDHFNAILMPKPPNPDWRYSASLRAGMQGAVHMDEAGALRVGPGPEQQWPTVSSATTEPEAGEVSPPVGAGVNSNSWTFKYGPGNSKQPGPGELPDKFIIPGSPAIISIRQDPPNSQTDKSDFITFGKKEETKKKKKKKKGNKAQEKKEKGNSTTDNSDQ
ncbi:protocadherin alpha-C1 isoform X2 [Anolis carolinensis]|uniref:Protocadherin alpha subfamily C, 2 n=1 Tax=Anolis carolinensis TaxID=28377 RepID=G1KMP7_ANOCA|nr:PREDICTED: protocadherin alpha-C1 isoform X3 [Anolis carolinensis]|eukprot:XP_016848544.1 PREDICTED: protocadherin alpha-C1 isoform X3 [Anolis carolinensis]